jgi:hypothetical protein
MPLEEQQENEKTIASRLDTEGGQAELKLRTLSDFITFEKEVVVPNADAQNAQLYPIFYVATLPCFVIEVKMRHEVNSSSGTVDVEVLTSGTARGSGTSVLSGVFSTAAGANTTQSRTTSVAGLSATNLNPGDALALKAAGTLTGASNITIGVMMGVNLKDIPTGPNIT